MPKRNSPEMAHNLGMHAVGFLPDGKGLRRYAKELYSSGEVKTEHEFREALKKLGKLDDYTDNAIRLCYFNGRRDAGGARYVADHGVAKRIRELYDEGMGMVVPRDIWLKLAKEKIYTTTGYVADTVRDEAKRLNIWQRYKSYQYSRRPYMEQGI